MKIPCEDCITLPICKAKAQNYDSDRHRIPVSIFRKCIEGSEFDSSLVVTKIRIFLRPDLKTDIYGVPYGKRRFEDPM